MRHPRISQNSFNLPPAIPKGSIWVSLPGLARLEYNRDSARRYLTGEIIKALPVMDRHAIDALSIEDLTALEAEFLIEALAKPFRVFAGAQDRFTVAQHNARAAAAALPEVSL